MCSMTELTKWIRFDIAFKRNRVSFQQKLNTTFLGYLNFNFGKFLKLLFEATLTQVELIPDAKRYKLCVIK